MAAPFSLVQVDANMVHGWPPSPCATERVISLWGTLCHHVESGVSRFIPSTLGGGRSWDRWRCCGRRPRRTRDLRHL